ncbi:MAG TPA: pyridoxamine 5'-phosphate oxidase family protein, partial [Mycobacterium sp.]|nr:pyridoxamine 5'-phosphate oxidase family protein [Mycobacterium sp.]
TPDDPYAPHNLTTPTPNYSAKLVKHDRALALSILREGFFCHIGFYDPEAKVVRVLPRQYGLADDALYLHGPAAFGATTAAEPPVEHASRLYRLIALGHVKDVCATVSLVDALALSDAGVHSALSYRSVVVYGKASVVTDTSENGEVANALRTISNHIAPGYADAARPANQAERNYVGVIRIDFVHVSAKARTGGPTLDDKAATGASQHWAGVVPIRQVYGPPITASGLKNSIPVPDYVTRLVGGRGATNVDVDPPRHTAEEPRPTGAPQL